MLINRIFIYILHTYILSHYKLFHKWWPLPGYVTNPLCDKKSFIHSVNQFFVLGAPFSLFKVDFCFFVWQHIEESPYTCADPHYHCAECLIGMFWNWFVLLIIIYLVSINNICLKEDVLLYIRSISYCFASFRLLIYFSSCTKCCNNLTCEYNLVKHIQYLTLYQKIFIDLWVNDCLRSIFFKKNK